MVGLLFLTATIGFSLMFARSNQCRFEFAPAISLSIITCALYGAAGLNFLNEVAIFIFITGCILFFYGIFDWLSSKNQKLEVFPSLFLYVLILMSVYWLMKDRGLSAWDDFSHWAVVVKDMANSHKLVGPDSSTVFKDYPPAGSLFSYYILSIEYFLHKPELYGAINEGLALFAQAVLVITCLFPVMALAFAKLSLSKALIVILILLISVFSFGFNFNNLMIDIVVGSYFALGFIIYIRVKQDGLRSLWILVPVLMVLVLLKKVGLFLSFILIIYIGIDQFLTLRKQKTNKSRQIISRIIFITILLMSVIACNYSWKLHVQSIHGSQTFSTDMPISELERSFFGASTEKEKIIKKNFLDQLKPIRVGNIDQAWVELKVQKIATMTLALIVFSILIVLKHSKERSYEKLTLYAALFVGFVFYLLGLLILYYFSFGEYEAIRLASFDRYVGIYLFAWFVVLSMDYLLTYSNKLSCQQLAILIMMLLFLGYSGIKSFFKPSTYVSDFQRQITEQLKNEKIRISSNLKFYYLSQCDAGFKYLVFRYFIYPAKVASGPYAIGPTCFQGDVWTQNIPVEKFKDLLLDHVDYLVLDRPNVAFWEIYGSNFRNLDSGRELQIIPIQKLQLNKSEQNQ